MKKNKKKGSFWAALLLFSLTGQVAWIVENMYLNVFIYKIFSASASDISLMVAASAITATLTTVLMGALSDRVGKRKLFICGGYIAWGISIFAFALIRLDVIGTLFPSVIAASSVGITLVIIMDCVMTFFGSTANDAAFNAWLTDSTDESNRGAAEGLNAMMPLVAILVVFGGFMFFDLGLPQSWTAIFIIIGIAVTLIGVLGIFLIKEPTVTPDKSSYFRTVLYGFSPAAIKENAGLYLCFAAFTVFNISIQIFMPYLIIYYEVSLGMTDYVFIMAPAIILASVVTALWGRVFDKKGFRFSVLLPLVWLLGGYALLFIFRSVVPVFIGSLLMMSGYLAGAAAFGARMRQQTPEGRAGQLQGVRIFTQVLLPGIIGPFIGKTVLADAKTVVGNDGTSSFVPSADIFAAAAVPVLLLLVLLLIFSKKEPPKHNDLKTPYDTGDIPHDYHPDPQLKRSHFENLNGRWRLQVIRGGRSRYEGSILVPFPPESALSGVDRVTARGDTLVYSRSFNAAAGEGRTLLHLGAVDNKAEVFVNGVRAGEHLGGYLPFTLDITEHLNEGENLLTVTVTDSFDKSYPYGKQCKKPHGMWYTPVSGIWQTVWLEKVPENYIKSLRTDTTLGSVTLRVEGGEQEKLLLLEGKEYRFCGECITVELEEPRLWTPETPELYEFSLISGNDRVESYFALRQIGSDCVKGKQVLTLNGKPYYFHGLLDQGYFPDGIFMPPSAQGFEDDILRMKELGFNMLRKHIKIEPKIFYYYCDKHGMAVFQDMVNNGRYSFIYDTALPTLGLKRLPRHESRRRREIFLSTALATQEHLHNHPCVVYYTIFNEGWGQSGAKEAYARLKAADPSRIYDTASGWFGGAESDVQSEHVYFKPAKFALSNHRPSVLSEFGGYSLAIESHVYNPDKVFGYKICKSREELTAELQKLYREQVMPLVRAGLSASVLTQLSDVENETNGMLTYDRAEIKPDPDAMRAIAADLKNA